MPDFVTVKMQGLEQLEVDLNELSSDMRRRVVRQGLRDASRPVVKAAKGFAKPRDFQSKRRMAGTMRRAISTFNSKKYKGANGVIGVFITVRASRAQIKRRPISGDPFYWRFVEAGHRIVPRTSLAAARLSRLQKRLKGITITQRRRRATGRVQAYPFLGPAFRAQGDAARRAFVDVVTKRIQQANAKR